MVRRGGARLGPGGVEVDLSDGDFAGLAGFGFRKPDRKQALLDGRADVFGIDCWVEVEDPAVGAPGRFRFRGQSRMALS